MAGSFELIYEQYYDKVFNFIYMRILNREDAEDITEDTFIKAMTAFGNYDPEKSSYITWLCTIARNCMVDHIRKSHRDKIVPFDETYEAGEIDSEIEKLTDDTERQVYDIMSHLKQDERELLSMRYKLNMDYNQIAAVTGISSKAAAKRVERILKKCRDYVAL